MHWMKHALFEWSQAVELGDEANTLIEKYCKDDANKAKVCRIEDVDSNKFSLLTNICGFIF